MRDSTVLHHDLNTGQNISYTFPQTHVKGAHFLEEDVGLFDANFFGYSAETASSLDPQYRLQLESVYEAIESAGLPLAQIAGSNTSVFTGVFVHDYRDGLLRDADNLPRLMATGTGVPMMSNRISHFFDLHGTSMTIETACSSGMVALHQGIQSLRTHEADLSIVGGANLTLNPDMFKALSSSGFLSGDGKCYAFDSRASGYGRGEGVATLLIKRLREALADGDPIRAVIRESLLNQDGRTETITAPSVEAQEALIRDCYRRAGLRPEDTQYFEAHGTGTQAGDTIEARAIATVFGGSGRRRENPLLMGSIKTNIGHTEAASGLASIIKTALAMERGVIPPSINFEKPNPKIALDDWNLKLVTDTSWRPEPVAESGSTNGYSNGLDDEAQRVLILSAKDQSACQRMVSNLKNFLVAQKESIERADPRKFLESLAYTLGQRRSRFSCVAVYPVPVTKGVDAVVRALDSPAFKPSRNSRRPRIVGRELVNAYPTYKASLEMAGAYLEEFGANWSLLEELSRDADTSRINEVALSTPICIAVQISLLRLLRAWGVVPVAVTSHWSGEIAAAYAAGALSFREAMAVSYYRAVLAAGEHPGRAPGKEEGAMIAVGLGVDETESYLRRLTQANGKAVVACINSPSSTTVSGDVSAVKELEELANIDGVFARRLRINTAWHSHHMVSVAEAYIESIDRATTPAGKKDATARRDDDHLVAFSSPVTGGRISRMETLARSIHWADSLLRPVQFVDAFTDMVMGQREPNTSSNVDVIIEVGPHTALGGPIQEILALPEFHGLQIPYYGCLVRKTDALGSMQALAAGLLREGYPVDMDAVNFPHGRSQQDIKVLTTLPLYPWNHQNKHWIEPRFNRALRARSEPPHDLLGSLVDGSNPDAPSWRHILRITDAPWTQDHVIQSSIVFPAAGYICLAIEAVRQLSMIEGASDRSISGYRLRDIDFMQALLIPSSSDGIEIQTQLRTASNRDLGARGWKHFEVWTVTADNRWIQHAKGLVSVEFDKTPTAEAVEPVLQGYARRVRTDDFFSGLRALGIAHGPMFQNMREILQSGSGSGSSHSVVTMAIPDTSVPNDLVRDPVVHPVTLDSIITAPYSTLSAAAARQATAKVPRAVESFWVSSAISHSPGHLLRAHSWLVRDDSQGMEAGVSVFDHDSGSLVLEMGRFSYQSLGRGVASAQQTTEPWEKELNSLVKWAPDISTGSPATFAFLKKQLSLKKTEDWHDDVDETTKIWQICMSFMQQAIANLDSRDADRVEPRYAKYYAWLVDTVQQAASGQLCIGGATWLPDKAPGNPQRHMDQETGETRNVNVEIVCRLGAHLVDILRGEVPPLPLMVQDNLLARFYDNIPALKRTGSQLSGLLAHLVHKNPRARILEIGAGTGTMTRFALSALGTPQSGGPAADSYHYTDASAALFDTARETLAPWSDLLVFDVLDPQREPAAQGFAHGTYDVVIASGVVSAETNSVSRTLGSARNLLKPGGVLLLTEVVQDKVLVPFVQALLLPERQIESNTVLATDVWDRHLRDAGFSGVSLELRDCSDSRASTSVTIMSTVPLPTLPEPYVEPENVLIVTSRRAAPPPVPWLKGLQALIGEGILGRGNISVATQDLESATASSYAHKFCIFIGEVNKPILHDLDPAALEGIQTMCTACKGLLWLTRGGAVDCERPEFSLASGFIRTLRTEHVARRLLTLDLDPAGAPWSDSSASAIVQVLRAALFDKAEAGSIVEPEYAERDGVMLVPRFYHDTERDQVLSSRGVLEPGPGPTLEPAPKTSIEPFHQQDRLLCLRPETLAFGDDEAGATYHDSPLPPNLLEVEPRAYGVSSGPADRENHIRGLECAGIVTRVGSGAAVQDYKVGDRVVCVLHQEKQSSFPNRVAVEPTATVHKPANLSFQEAVSVPLAFLTAYFSLVEVARLQRAQWVLIHAAAEPTGQAAIMIAQHVEAKVLATVGNPEQRVTLTEKYGIPAESIFMLDTSDLPSFESTILAATQGHGVDVVLNSLGGPLLQHSFNLVAPFGHFVEVSGRDSKANSNLEMRPFSRSISFTSVDLDLMLEHRVADVHRCLREIMRMIEVRAFAPVHPIVSYALGDVLEASRLLQEKSEPRFTGKVVLSVDQDARVPVLQVPRRAKLAGDASYLIVGGNGGLGQSVAHWMASRGARNLILLSRSASKSAKMVALVKELRETGCRVLPVDCDIADEDDLAQAVQKSAAEGLPPIRGIVHAAFVLRDAFVEKMTFQDWKDTTQSKVAGAWNLHSCFNLPDDLDFFVLFSSINGLLGYASQAAYSAGGAYEDALAHWRVKQCGLPAVSIDLPVVDTVGYVAEASSSEKLRRSLIKAGHRPIDVNGVLASLESAIQRPFDPQFAVGINSGPGSHWDVDGALGRDPRSLALKYRPLTQAAAQQQQQQQQQSLEEEGGSLAAKMTACTSRDDGIRVVGEAIAEVLAEMFLVPVEDIDLTESPAHQGVDSLMAVELRNVLFSQAGAEISIFNIMQAPSLVSLATAVVGCSRYIKFAADSL
nr:polyketide synthase 4 [Chaetomium globosum]